MANSEQPDDAEKNQAQRNYDQTVGNGIPSNKTAESLNDAESQAGGAPRVGDDIGSQEAAPKNTAAEPDAINSSYTGKRNKGKAEKTKGKGRFFNRKSAIGTIIVTLLGGGGIISLIFAPGLLFVQIQAALVDRFDTRTSMLTQAQTRLQTSKMSAKTLDGICGTKLTIKCKFHTMSAKNVEIFKAAGIEVEGQAAIGKRVKPTKFIFEGKEISAGDFNKELNSNPKFRSAILKAYNPRLAAFADGAWSRFAKFAKFSKSAPDLGNTDEERAAKLQEISNRGSADLDLVGLADGVECDENDRCVDKDGKELNEEQKRELRAAQAAAADLGNAEDKSAEKALAAIGDTSNPLRLAASAINITGGVDAACQARAALRGLGYAAKTIRALQLARYALTFVNFASQIRAGDVDPDDLAYMGGILTNVSYDIAGGVTRKAAMDSAGMKYSMFGDTSGFKGQAGAYASQFLAGGGLTGDLIAVSNYIDNTLPLETAKTTCEVLSNGWVQLGSVVGGIGLMLVPGVGQAISVGKAAAQLGASAALQIGLAILPDLLKDIVAGKVTEGLVGEGSGNAIASGFGTAASSVARAGGGGLTTVDEAIVAANDNQQIIARYAEQERFEKSPFDATSRYTFLGSIVNSFAPHISSNPVKSSIGILSSSFSKAISGVIPKTSALSDEELRDAYTLCQDPDYKEMGIATDPFCNPIYNIPDTYYSAGGDAGDDADAVAGEYNEETGAPVAGTKYEEIVKTCFENTDPIDDTKGVCQVKPETAKYFKFYNLLNAEEGNDGVNVATASTGTTTSTAGVEVDMSQIFVDSTSVACAPGTDFVRVDTAYNQGASFKINLCSLPNTIEADEREGNHPGYVNSRASGAAFAMFEELRTHLGVEKIALNDSFRTNEEQVIAKQRYGGQAANPGYSAHQTAIAFDINVGAANNGDCNGESSGDGCRYSMNANASYPGNKVWEWLVSNAGKYSFKQYPPEGWHWSVTGG